MLLSVSGIAKHPSPLRGEGEGEGDDKYFVHPPLNPLPSREGRSNGVSENPHWMRSN
jgi:hypothetical protein